MTNDELIQKAERWLKWYPKQYGISQEEMGLCNVLRECVAALKADTPASTQPNPSPVDLSAPDWLARYATPLPGEQAQPEHLVNMFDAGRGRPYTGTVDGWYWNTW